jgi:hypothetical protein
MLPAPGSGLPGVAALDLHGFWPRFEAAAPRSLRFGFWLAIVVLTFLPWFLGYWRSFGGLSEDERDEVLQRAARIPGIDGLLDLTKLVVCLAYFEDPHVEATVRGQR